MWQIIGSQYVNNVEYRLKIFYGIVLIGTRNLSLIFWLILLLNF